MPEPRVSVVMPARQEEGHIRGALASLIPQVEACDGELIVAEGGSTDRTKAILEELARTHECLRIVVNPTGHPAVGLNIAISAAKANLIVRADAHSEYADDYLERSLAAACERPDSVVGGRLSPVACGGFGEAVAAAMTSKWAVGPGAFHHASAPQPADTVYLGAFPIAVIEAVHGYRAFPSRAGEDADFCARVRRAGMQVWLDPAIKSIYRPRRSRPALLSQSWRYGRAKAEILLATGSLPSWRPLAPAGLTALMAAAVLSPTRRPARRVLWLWLAALAWSSRRSGALVQRARYVEAAALMQSAYGAGFWFSLARGRRAGSPLTGREAGWHGS